LADEEEGAAWLRRHLDHCLVDEVDLDVFALPSAWQ